MNKGVIAVVGVIVLCGAAALTWMLWPGSQAGLDKAATNPATRVADTQTEAELPVTPDQVRVFIEIVDRDDLANAEILLINDTRLAYTPMLPEGEWPLHHVCSAEMAKLLVDYGGNLDVRDFNYRARPIRWVLGRSVRDHDKVMALVGSMAELSGADTDVAYLVASGDVPALNVMLEQDPSVANAQADKDVLGNKYTMINLAAKFNQPEVAELLLAHGADANSRGGEFYDAPALEYAAWAGNAKVVKVLLEHGAGVNAVIHTEDQGDHTALWWAALTGRKEVVKLLVEAGAIVDPALPEAVANSKKTPYFGRNLPPQEDYDAVIKLLNEHITH